MRLIFVVIATAMIASAPLSTVRAQDGGPIKAFNPICTVLARRLNLRSGPGANYPVIGKLKTGTLLNVTGRNRNVSWVQIEVRKGDQTGWVNADPDSIACLGLVSKQPVVHAPPPPAKPAARVQPASPAAPAPLPNDIPAPNAIAYDGSGFNWEWGGLAMIPDPNWYFDIKVYANRDEAFPYAVEIPNFDELERSGPNHWRYGKSTDFRCGSEWSVQIARRNPDGSFAGFISPESQRLPTNQGCNEPSDGGSDNSDGGNDNDPGPAPCPYC
jgi:hypothetical protein